MIYFLHAPGYKLIKIGYSTNVEKRIHDITSTMPFVELKCLRIIDGQPSQERKLHLKFQDLRLNNSEWFKAEGKLLNYIFDPKNTNTEFHLNDFIASIFPHGYCAKILNKY